MTIIDISQNFPFVNGYCDKKSHNFPGKRGINIVGFSVSEAALVGFPQKRTKMPGKSKFMKEIGKPKDLKNIFRFLFIFPKVGNT